MSCELLGALDACAEVVSVKSGYLGKMGKHLGVLEQSVENRNILLKVVQFDDNFIF